MGIVLNENDWAREMIERRSLGKKPVETLSRVARYYIDKKYNKRDVRKMLDTFVIQCEPSASLPKWEDILDFAVKRASKTEAVKIEKIVVTKPEIEKISALEGAMRQRLAFTLLVLSKYWNMVNGNPESNWVNSSDPDVAQMANIELTVKRRCRLYHDLYEAGLIRFSKKVNNTNVQVLFAEDGDPALEVRDLRNLGNQYMLYMGGPYFVCQNCGITERCNNVKRRTRQKYCKRCAAEVKKRQTYESVKKYRSQNDTSQKNVRMLEPLESVDI